MWCDRCQSGTCRCGDTVQVNEFYIVWAEGKNQPVVKHTTYETAIQEAKRLARNNSGHRFFVLKALGFATREDPPAVYVDKLTEGGVVA